jgi:hypothetical protein
MTNYHNFKILSLVKEGFTPFEDGDSLNKPCVFDVILILFDISMRQKFHHVKIYISLQAFISTNDTSHLENFGLQFLIHIFSIIFGFQFCLNCFLVKRFNSFEYFKLPSYDKVYISAYITFFVQDLISCEGMPL